MDNICATCAHKVVCKYKGTCDECNQYAAEMAQKWTEGQKMRDKQLAQFFKDRDAALLSLDMCKILAFYYKHGIQAPKNANAFWEGVHKAIFHMKAASIEQKLFSCEWLLRHGYTTEL